MHNYVNIIYSNFLCVNITTCTVDFIFHKEEKEEMINREIAEFINGLKLERALTFINKIRRKFNYVLKEENYFDGVFFDFRGLKIDSKEEFLEFKSFLAYSVLNNLTIDQIMQVSEILKDKNFCEKLLYASRDFKMGSLYKLENMERDSEVFHALISTDFIFIRNDQP